MFAGYPEQAPYSYTATAMPQTEVEFTYDQAVRTLGVTPEKLDRLIDEGKIAVVRGLETRIPRESILAYLATVTSVGKEKKKAAAPAREAPARNAAAAADAAEAAPAAAESAE